MRTHWASRLRKPSRTPSGRPPLEWDEDLYRRQEDVLMVDEKSRLRATCSCLRIASITRTPDEVRQVREAFQDPHNSFYFCTSNGRQWFSHEEVRWDGPTMIFGNLLGFLEQPYGEGMRRFFVDVLKVQTSPLANDYIRALSCLKD